MLLIVLKHFSALKNKTCKKKPLISGFFLRYLEKVVENEIYFIEFYNWR